MGFCCGAGMIGSIGNVRHQNTLVMNVPILYCPVCDRIEVHPAIEGEYEILVEYAKGDHAPEVDFSDFVSVDNITDLFENCSVTDQENQFETVMKQQIDMALDLLIVAKQLDDTEWQGELMGRLKRLSDRLKSHQTRKEISQRSA